MSGCNCETNVPFDGLSNAYKKVLWIVIGINFAMFLVEMVASQVSGSMALSADALDFFGDSLTYMVTLLVIGHGLLWRARAAIFKGLSLAVMGLWVLGSTLYQVFVLEVPNEMIMGSIAMLAFSANVISALLLMRYRDGDANVRSVWLCSRNDAIGNLAVLMAAGVVYLTQSRWPDLIVAFLMAGLFLHSASLILIQARKELQQARKEKGQVGSIYEKTDGSL
ncbi:MAG: cation transporter [Thiotrichales bacterium]